VIIDSLRRSALAEHFQIQIPVKSGVRRLWPALLLMAALTCRILSAKSGGPDPGLTGGFQENTCIRCHSSHGLNEGRALGGFFSIEGVPRIYEPGKTYSLTMMIAHPGQSRWGFELSARFADSGKQAGSLGAADNLVQIKSDDTIQYALHTSAGTRDGEKDGPVAFRVNWTAPPTGGGMVIFNASGNAANGNEEPDGDYIYTAGNFSRPGSSSPVEEATITEANPTAVDASKRRLSETSRIVDLPSPVDLKRGSMEILIQHRFLGSFGDPGVGAGNAWGIDYGANINIGFNYALTDRLSVGTFRARDDQVVEFSGTFEILTKRESPIKLALRGGVEGRKNFHEAYSPSLQFAAAYDFKRFRFNVVPGVVFNSRPALDQFSRPRALNPGSDYSAFIGLGTDIMLTRKMSLIAEYAPRIAGYGGLDERHDQVAGGLMLRTWGHVFTILVATSKDFTPAKFGVNAESSDVSIGFNIYRRVR
jgi:hypothetical protein